MTRLFLLGCCLTLSCVIRVEEKGPNFVFLLVDDLGWGDFGCYGAEFYETPHIDKLAKDEMLFTNAYSACKVCSPSRAAILMGRYPARLQFTDWITGYKRPFAKLAVPDEALIKFFENGELELFNLKTDSFERKNLAAENPREAATAFSGPKGLASVSWSSDDDAKPGL